MNSVEMKLFLQADTLKRYKDQAMEFVSIVTKNILLLCERKEIDYKSLPLKPIKLVSLISVVVSTINV